MTPTQRTLAELRRLGYMAAVVERRNPVLKHVTIDLFGIIDVMAVGHGVCPSCNADRENLDSCLECNGRGETVDPETLAIQTTSGSNAAARVTKILAARWPRANEKKGTPGGELVLPRLIAAGWRIEVWGWRKSRRTSRWEVRREVVSG